MKYSNFCDFKGEITIPDNPAPDNSVQLSIDNPEVTEGEPFTVLAEYENTSNIDTFEWTPPGKLLKGEAEKAIFVLDTSSSISLQMTDKHGCTYTDRIFINITVEDVPEEEISLFIPNSFTPNEDGTNDRLELFSSDPNLIIEEVRIFDRYGKNLHSRTGPIPKADLWDGRANQKKVLPGVYVLKLHIRRKGQAVKQIIPDVTVIR